MVRSLSVLLVFLSLAVPREIVAASAAGGGTGPDGRRGPGSVALHVSAGYAGSYNPSAWVPVRVTVRNRTSSLLAGELTVPDTAATTRFANPAYHTVYQASLVLPPSGVKDVTLYIPGSDVQDAVDVQFRASGRVLATGSGSLTALDGRTLVIGALSDNPELVFWLRGLRTGHRGVDVADLTTAALDPVSQALSTFDLLVVSNVDASRLDADQLDAVDRYVRDGGSLLLVGGPDWQESLRPLPSGLLPGRLSGTRALDGLAGLHALAPGALPGGRAVVSRILDPRGSVSASQDGVPLVVRRWVGRGQVLYLAFDPAMGGVAGSPGGSRALSRLVSQTAPSSDSPSISVGLRFGLGIFGGQYGPSMMRRELANVPHATQSSLMLLVGLIILSVLILGPLNFLLLSRLGKPELAWVALPVLSVLCLLSILGATYRSKGSVALVNTVSFVRLDGQGTADPATLYTGLFSSVSGNYHLVWNDRALPMGLPQYSFFQSALPSSTPLGMTLQEGPQTSVSFPSMSMWSTRGVALTTTVKIPGRVQGVLRRGADGSVRGTIRNSTELTITHGAVVAPGALVRLRDLPPGGSETVRFRLHGSVLERDPIFFWNRVLGSSPESADLANWDGDPWEEPPPATESSMVDRLRNVALRLPEARSMASLGNLLFIGWSQDHLGSMTVDGAQPQRRDLNLLVTPLTVQGSPRVGVAR